MKANPKQYYLPTKIIINFKENNRTKLVFKEGMVEEVFIAEGEVIPLFHELPGVIIAWTKKIFGESYSKKKEWLNIYSGKELGVLVAVLGGILANHLFDVGFTSEEIAIIYSHHFVPNKNSEIIVNKGQNLKIKVEWEKS